MSQDLEVSTIFFRSRFVPFGDGVLSIASAPMLYGLSVYTVVPVAWTEKQGKAYIFRLADHYKRLQNSAKIMDFHNFLNGWTFEKFEHTVKQLLIRNKVHKDVLVRITLFVDEVMSGTKMHDLKHELAMFVYPWHELLPARGARLGVSSWQRTPDNAIPSRAKINGGYVNVSLMKHEALAHGYDDAIALDVHGHVAESTVANLFVVRDGVLITPSGSTDLLEGITRDTVNTLARAQGITCVQRSIDRSELYIADEVFMSGSSVRITPVVSIDDRDIGTGKIGVVTSKIRQHYDDVTHAKNTDFAEWRTAVNVS